MIRMKLYERVDEQTDVSLLRSDCSIYCAYSENTLLGYCTFYYEKDAVVLSELTTDPCDISLADGLARAAIAVASNRCKTTVKAEGEGQLNTFVLNTGVFIDSYASIDDVQKSTGCKKDILEEQSEEFND